MTRLRKLMLEELQRRNFSAETIRGYVGAVEQFAQYFRKPPDQLGPDHIRTWQAYLLHERKLAVGTVVNRVAALRFFFRRVLKRQFPPDSIPYPNYSHHRTPRVLSPDEVARLIDAAGNLQARTILMTLYSTGMRRSELVGLRVEDIDSERMVIHRAKEERTAMCRSVPDSSKHSVNTGGGRSRKRGCFPVSHPRPANTSPTKLSGMSATMRPNTRASGSASVPTC